jgi:pimeloyl-ACP methyl ester carboxylesterase
MSVASSREAQSLVVNGTRIDFIEKGAGPPLLYLHAENGIEPAAKAIDELAKHAHVIAPTHPGYGRSELPKGMRTVDDLSYFYLDLFDQLDLKDLTVVGTGFGGWIAAEIAVKTTARLARLVMANAVGVKVGDRETRDIADIFALTEPEYIAIAYCDPDVGKRDYKESVFSQSAAQKPAAPHPHPDAVFVGQPRPHAQRILRPRLLRDDCGRPLRTDRPRRAFPRSRATEGFCREGAGVRESQMTPEQESAP